MDEQLFEIGAEELLSNADIVSKYSRFLQRLETDTAHKAYLKGQLEALLDEQQKGRCVIHNISIPPYYNCTVFISSETDSIISVIKGYDIQRMPESQWNEIWGE